MRAVLLGLAVVALGLAGCGGKLDEGDLVVSDSQGALAGGGGVADDEEDGDRGDDGCKDGDHDGHARHRRHWFKVLDALDGARDHAITLADLPPGLPPGLLAKLHRIDRNGDGVVTKDEVKAARKRHARRHHEDGDRDERDDD